MKHPIKITSILLIMFFVTQLIGLAVISVYSPEVKQTIDTNGTIKNTTVYNLPFGTEPPEDIEPNLTFALFIPAIILAVILMFILMRFRAELIIKLWFLFVVTLAMGITFNAILLKTPISSLTPHYSLIALAIAIPLAVIKIFRQNIIVHNVTELAIYPGIAAIFVPLLNLWTIILLLILISIYDIYAVWHAGFMQKMAKYQINTLKVFGGFLIPSIGDKERAMIEKAKDSKVKINSKKIKINVAILGGGDVIFPLILAGVVFNLFGFLSALIVSISATIALFTLLIFSQKGKFYPAMPFITIGCFVGLGIAYLVSFL